MNRYISTIICMIFALTLFTFNVGAQNSAGINIFYDSGGNKASIHISKTVTDFDVFSYAYDPYGTLKEIVVDSENQNFSSVDGVLYSKDMKILYCYPSGKSGKKFAVPNSVEIIGDHAFSCSRLVEVVLPESLKEIQGFAFYWCYHLEEINIPYGIDSIQLDCANIRKIVFPEISRLHIQNSNRLENIVFLGEIQPYGTYCSRRVIFQNNAQDIHKIHFVPCYCDFSDLPNIWALSEIDSAKEKDLITQRTSYGYKSVITRSEFAELVVNMLEKVLNRELEQQENAFTDTYNIAAEKAYAAGIVDGVGNKCFSPGQLVTREQIAAMLCRAITYIETKTGKDIIQLAESIPAVYADKADVSNWAVSSVATLNAAEIMKGTSSNTLSPQDNTTVQEAILLIYRIYMLCV